MILRGLQGRVSCVPGNTVLEMGDVTTQIQAAGAGFKPPGLLS